MDLSPSHHTFELASLLEPYKVVYHIVFQQDHMAVEICLGKWVNIEKNNHVSNHREIPVFYINWKKQTPFYKKGGKETEEMERNLVIFFRKVTLQNTGNAVRNHH